MPETAFCTTGTDRFTGLTINDVLKALNEFTGNDDAEAVLLNSCDELGRVDIQIMETAEGYPADKRDLAEFRRSERRLWLSCYSFYVKQVERQPISLVA